MPDTDSTTAEPDLSFLDDLAGFHLRRAQVRLFQHFREQFHDLGITPGQVGILALIRNNQGISQAALARAVRVERATLGETLRYLVEKSWVDRRPDPADRRINSLYLSEAGECLISETPSPVP